ncbi:MAG: hypothetical protein CM1200mP3_03580 [Chloroflexota bacterium]|nr:MAG: hypothetical protein CM1200mP3_03580 [Chloroflexota bacterium]
MNALQGEYFGRQSQGVIRGWLQSIGIPFSIAAPVLAGYMADIQGDYRMTFIVTSFVMLIGAFFISAAKRPAAPGFNYPIFISVSTSERDASIFETISSTSFSIIQRGGPTVKPFSVENNIRPFRRKALDSLSANPDSGVKLSFVFDP